MSEDETPTNNLQQNEPHELVEPVSTIPAAPEAAAPDFCPNCQAMLYGQWCYQCGQNQKPVDRFFLSLVNESFEDILSWDSRAAKTLFAILFRPGYLTREYFAGRRARYVPPLRLYLITSILFFSFLSLQNFIDPPTVNEKGIVIGDTRVEPEHNRDPDDASKTDANDIAEATDPEGTQDDLEELQVEVDSVNFSFLTPDQNQSLRNRLKAQIEKAYRLGKEDPAELLDALIDAAPPVLFLLVPVFALLLKFSYLMSGRYYTEHLVLAVHNHCFLFIILMVDFFVIGFEDVLPIVEDWGRTLIRVWVPLYMYLSLLRAYRQGYFVTFLKFSVLGISYVVLLALGLVVAMFTGMMTL
jgi:hypothetical protein